MIDKFVNNLDLDKMILKSLYFLLKWCFHMLHLFLLLSCEDIVPGLYLQPKFLDSPNEKN